MLRNKSRAVTKKQSLMGDPSLFPQSNTKSVQSFFSSPFCSSQFPKLLPQNKHYSWDKLDLKGIGVALIGDEGKSNQNTTTKQINKMVLFGTNLKVQIPTLASNLAACSPKSPADFGIKTKIPQFSASGFANPAQVFTGCVSMSELELSEDYTCVISYGPNPKTTHIYHSCVLEKCCSLSGESPDSFPSSCHTCKKKLEQKNDISMHRGSKAYCSQACKYREMLQDGIES